MTIHQVTNHTCVTLLTVPYIAGMPKIMPVGSRLQVQVAKGWQMRLLIRHSTVIYPSRKYLEMTGAFLEIAIHAAKNGERNHTSGPAFTQWNGQWP